MHRASLPLTHLILIADLTTTKIIGMKIQLLFAAAAAILLLYCHKKTSGDLIPGTWQVKKIDIFSDNQLRKTIDTGYQYWRFYKDDSIHIYDHATLQNCLHIKMDKQFIHSIDSKNRTDQFSIDTLNNQILELSSKQCLPDEEYTIVYHLEKME